MKDLVILMPAAGQSSRMGGRDKLLEEIDGAPLLRRQAERAALTGYPVLVTLPADRPKRLHALMGCSGIESTIVTDAADGMSASLKTGAHWAAERDAQAMMVLLPDLPDLGTDDMLQIASVFAEDPRTPCRASDVQGKPGHPVILPAALLDHIANLTGDQGAAKLLQGQSCRLHPLPGLRATTDLDTPEDWDAWRAAR